MRLEFRCSLQDVLDTMFPKNIGNTHIFQHFLKNVSKLPAQAATQAATEMTTAAAALVTGGTSMAGAIAAIEVEVRGFPGW